MEKFSKWRDPSTGLQPFLPLQSPPSTPVSLALIPFGIIFALVRALLLVALFLVYLVFVHVILTPFGVVGRPFANILTAILARAALGVLGYYWIDAETASAKRGNSKGVAQATHPNPRRGDLIITNWTSYVDVLYFAFRHNPTFLLPVFTEPAMVTPTSTPGTPSGKSFGRATGTGSASILLPTSTSTCAGYVALSPLALLARTGELPPTLEEAASKKLKVYKTLREARGAAAGPALLFPEGTTSNGRAVLRFGEGVLSEDVGKVGVTWVKFMRHAHPTALLPSATCPIPTPLAHLRTMLTSFPVPHTAAIRTLHASASPSSPSFLPSEIVATQPGGLKAVRDEATAWREACAIILAETGRVRRVPGMGWVEKASFLEYYATARRR